MALTDTAIRKAKPEDRDRKVADEKGLYLQITAKGSKLWRLKYRFGGKEKKLALGSYPEVGLKDARAKRDEARRMLAEGLDPAAVKREEKLASKLAAENTFRSVGEEFIAKLKAEGKSPTTVSKLNWLLSKLTPAIGDLPISEISPHELLYVLRTEERARHYETARRLRSFASRVFRFAIATTRASSDPAQALQGALISPVAKHHSAITEPSEFGKLLFAIEKYSGQPITRLAMLFSAHVFQRPGEVRQAEWAEIDFAKATWTIPAERMKQRQPHRVPLSKQAVEILQEVGTLSGGGRYVFPKLGSMKKPLSENAVNQALRRLGFGPEQMTAHGFSRLLKNSRQILL